MPKDWDYRARPVTKFLYQETVTFQRSRHLTKSRGKRRPESGL